MDAFKAYLKDNRGEQTRIAKELGIWDSAITHWDRVPAERLFAISRLTGIPIEKLRPDLVNGNEGTAA
jgi:DNA-binding transcriptional regulator YdaS (Cro superfamily)